MRFSRSDTFCVATLCTLAAIAFDYACAPAWYSGSPLLAVAALLLLACRQNDSERDESLDPPAPPISWQRLVVFCGLHVAIILAGRASASPLRFAGLHYSILTSAIVAGKLIVLFPSLVLLPWHAWKQFALRFRQENVRGAHRAIYVLSVSLV